MHGFLTCLIFSCHQDYYNTRTVVVSWCQLTPVPRKVACGMKPLPAEKIIQDMHCYVISSCETNTEDVSF